MREWTKGNLRVEEVEFDNDLHTFEIFVDDEYIGTIQPDDANAMKDIVKELDENGADAVEMMEDGMGNTVDLDKDSAYHEFWKENR